MPQVSVQAVFEKCLNREEILMMKLSEMLPHRKYLYFQLRVESRERRSLNMQCWREWNALQHGAAGRCMAVCGGSSQYLRAFLFSFFTGRKEIVILECYL